MSEESKQGAPGGASPVCEICGRPKSYTAGNIPGSAWCWREWEGSHKTDTIDCYIFGYERLRASLSTAEKERAALEKLLSGVTAIQCDGCDRPVSVEWGPNDLRMIAPHVKHGVHGYVDPCPGSKLILLPAFAGDAAQAAPKTHDSSALEKALGALRAAIGHLGKMHNLAQYHVLEIESIADFDPTHENMIRARQAQADYASAELFLGAHVDGPKAPLARRFCLVHDEGLHLQTCTCRQEKA